MRLAAATLAALFLSADAYYHLLKSVVVRPEGAFSMQGGQKILPLDNGPAAVTEWSTDRPPEEALKERIVVTDKEVFYARGANGQACIYGLQRGNGVREVQKGLAEGHAFTVDDEAVAYCSAEKQAMVLQRGSTSLRLDIPRRADETEKPIAHAAGFELHGKRVASAVDTRLGTYIDSLWALEAKEWHGEGGRYTKRWRDYAASIFYPDLHRVRLSHDNLHALGKRGQDLLNLTGAVSGFGRSIEYAFDKRSRITVKTMDFLRKEVGEIRSWAFGSRYAFVASDSHICAFVFKESCTVECFKPSGHGAAGPIKLHASLHDDTFVFGQGGRLFYGKWIEGDDKRSTFQEVVVDSAHDGKVTVAHRSGYLRLAKRSAVQDKSRSKVTLKFYRFLKKSLSEIVEDARSSMEAARAKK